MQGFLILNCIIGGQTLAAVSGHLNDTLGIVIIGVISMLVSNSDNLLLICSVDTLTQVTFCGYRIIHW